jgi:hypothetical protein
MEHQARSKQVPLTMKRGPKLFQYTKREDRGMASIFAVQPMDMAAGNIPEELD